MRRFLLVLALAVGVLALLVAPAFASARTFYVTPSGTNDTSAIEAAFAAAIQAGPGSTVQLQPGTYHTTAICVQGFNGTFRGAGQGKTYIDVVSGTSPLGPVTLDNSGKQVAPWPSLYCFVGGSVCVSGMTAAITNPSPGQQWSNYGTPTTALGTVFQVTGERSATFSRLTFHDGSGDYDGFNVTSDISVTGRQYLNADGLPINLGPTGGRVTVTACSFTGENGLFWSGLTHGSLTVRDNVFESTNCCIGVDASDSRIAISDNRMDAADYDVSLQQGFAASYGAGAPLPALPAPRYVIADNDLICGPSGEAVMLLDNCPWFGAPSCLAATISGNHFDCGSSQGAAASVIGEYATQGINCWGNYFTGSASTGLYLGDDGTAADGSPISVSHWSIVGNDFHSLTTSLASIILGNGTTHCLVVGGPPPTTVLNEGVNNTLVNVTTVTDPPAAAATPMHALRQMKQLKGMMRP